MKNKNFTIGVITPAEIELGRQILLGVKSYCDGHPGSRMMLMSAESKRPAHDLLWGVGGSVDCIITHLSTKEDLEYLGTFSKHIVCTSNRSGWLGYPAVLNHDHQIGEMGARYLLSLGYREVVFLSWATDFTFAAEREAGFTHVVKKTEASLEVFEHCTQLSLKDVASELLSRRRSVAVMAPSDLHARWFAQALSDAGLSIPEEVAVLGVDDDSLENSLSPVNLSSIRVAGERIGYEAAQLGKQLVEGAHRPHSPLLIPPVRVIERRSTSQLAVEDKSVVKAVRFMRNNLRTIEGVQDVVNYSKLNRRTLEIRFQKQLANSIAQELTNVRMNKTRELLATTSFSVKEISDLVGYSEPRILSVAFKRETGESPSQYRQRVLPGS